MSWLRHRNNLIFVSALSAFFLFGFGKTYLGIGLDDNLYGLGITMAHILGAGALYTLFAIWKRYI